jgi:formylglycine-generating enzyme required for sulfatase activity
MLTTSLIKEYQVISRRSLFQGETAMGRLQVRVFGNREILLCLIWVLISSLGFGQSRGDVDGDGIITLLDAGMIKDHLLERTALTSGALTRADADGDGLVRMADVVWVINHRYGTITIDVTPSSGSWGLAGPAGFPALTGSGDLLGGSAIKGPPGDYTLICDDNVANYDPPSTQTKTLAAGGSIAFTPTYGPEEIAIHLPGNVPLVLVYIPAGSFQMGSPPTERSRWTDEGPLHTVNIAYSFFMGKYELTQRQWLALMGSWPDSTNNPPNYPEYGLGDTYPAYFISWDDAQNFIAALNTHVTNTGQGPATFRLPSEAEWEYACRAQTQTRFFFGDSLAVDDWVTDGPAGTLPGNRSDYMWFWFNCQGDANGAYGSKPVGTKLPNQFGLYDMSGNIWEWCQDWWHNGYTGAPTDGSAWESPAGTYPVIRGGDWGDPAHNCRSAYRDAFNPDTRSYLFGLRFVRTQ